MIPGGGFMVRTTTHYDRLSNKLHKGHGDFDAVERSAAGILSEDPHNRTRRNNLKKLEDIPFGEGQYRLSLGRWRFRFDVLDRVVLLTYCGLRREDTY
jgi:hypothetical protein